MRNLAFGKSVTRSDRLTLCAILALALGLRLFKLNTGLWYDEVDTLVSYTRPSFSWLLTHYPSLNHHIFFSLQAKASIALLGETPFAARLPAALLGVGSVAVLWLIARELSTRSVAHLCALLMAVAYHHVWFSQNARGYTGLLFWGLLAALFYVRGMAGASQTALRPNAIGLAVACALMLYTHLSAAFLLAAMGLVHLSAMARKWLGRSPDLNARDRLLWLLWGFAGGLGLSLLLYAPIVPQLLESFSSTSAGSKGSGIATEAIAHWNSPLWMLNEIASAFPSVGPSMTVAALGVTVVVAAGMANLRKRGHGALPATFIVHVPLTMLILQLGSMRVWPRYYFIDIGFICLFLVEGAMWFGALGDRLAVRVMRRSAGGDRLGIALSALGVLCAAAMLPKNYRFPKQDLVGARDFVEATRSDGSAVVALGLASWPFHQYYAPAWGKVESLAELLAVEKAHPEVWVVYSFPDVTAGRSPAVMSRLDYSFSLAKHLPGTLGDGDVFVYRSKYADAKIGVTDLGGGLSVLQTQGLIGGNIAVYAQGDDVLLVDSNAEPMARQVAQALKEITDRPPRFVINTHWHLDHAGGNAAFVERGAAIIAHPNAAQRLRVDLGLRQESVEHRLPTKLVDEQLTLTLAKQEVQIFHLPSAHTDGDLVVHFVNANVIHTGDLFVHGSFPFISGGSGGSIDGYIDAQERILALCDAQTRLIPGHGKVARRSDLVVTRDMLITARDRVSALRKKGQSLEQVMESDPLRDMQAKWGQGWITSPLMAKFIYTSLASEPPR